MHKHGIKEGKKAQEGHGKRWSEKWKQRGREGERESTEVQGKVSGGRETRGAAEVQKDPTRAKARPRCQGLYLSINQVVPGQLAPWSHPAMSSAPPTPAITNLAPPVPSSLSCTTSSASFWDFFAFGLSLDPGGR